jgi:hypothetical protein
MVYKIITLCGSAKFRDKVPEIFKELTKQKYIVITPYFFGPNEQDELEPILEDLEYMHFQRIDMADACFVVNPDGYIGKSTLIEIKWAYAHGKKVFYLSEYPDMIIPEEAWN